MTDANQYAHKHTYTGLEASSWQT